jgi:hypothetical protein
MAMWMQNLIVLTIVAGCAAMSVWQIVGSVRSKKGGCCAHGCGGEREDSAEKVVFLPVESLRSGRRKAQGLIE